MVESYEDLKKRSKKFKDSFLKVISKIIYPSGKLVRVPGIVSHKRMSDLRKRSFGVGVLRKDYGVRSVNRDYVKEMIFSNPEPDEEVDKEFTNLYSSFINSFVELYSVVEKVDTSVFPELIEKYRIPNKFALPDKYQNKLRKLRFKLERLKKTYVPDEENFEELVKIIFTGIIAFQNILISLNNNGIILFNFGKKIEEEIFGGKKIISLPTNYGFASLDVSKYRRMADGTGFEKYFNNVFKNGFRINFHYLLQKNGVKKCADYMYKVFKKRIKYERGFSLRKFKKAYKKKNDSDFKDDFRAEVMRNLFNRLKEVIKDYNKYSKHFKNLHTDIYALGYLAESFKKYYEERSELVDKLGGVEPKDLFNDAAVELLSLSNTYLSTHMELVKEEEELKLKWFLKGKDRRDKQFLVMYALLNYLIEDLDDDKGIDYSEDYEFSRKTFDKGYVKDFVDNLFDSLANKLFIYKEGNISFLKFSDRSFKHKRVRYITSPILTRAAKKSSLRKKYLKGKYVKKHDKIVDQIISYLSLELWENFNIPACRYDYYSNGVFDSLRSIVFDFRHLFVAGFNNYCRDMAMVFCNSFLKILMKTCPEYMKNHVLNDARMSSFKSFYLKLVNNVQSYLVKSMDYYINDYLRLKNIPTFERVERKLGIITRIREWRKEAGVNQVLFQEYNSLAEKVEKDVYENKLKEVSAGKKVKKKLAKNLYDSTVGVKKRKELRKIDEVAKGYDEKFINNFKADIMKSGIKFGELLPDFEIESHTINRKIRDFLNEIGRSDVPGIWINNFENYLNNTHNANLRDRLVFILKSILYGQTIDFERKLLGDINIKKSSGGKIFMDYDFSGIIGSFFKKNNKKYFNKNFDEDSFELDEDLVKILFFPLLKYVQKEGFLDENVREMVLFFYNHFLDLAEMYRISTWFKDYKEVRGEVEETIGGMTISTPSEESFYSRLNLFVNPSKYEEIFDNFKSRYDSFDFKNFKNKVMKYYDSLKDKLDYYANNEVLIDKLVEKDKSNKELYEQIYRKRRSINEEENDFKKFRKIKIFIDSFKTFDDKIGEVIEELKEELCKEDSDINIFKEEGGKIRFKQFSSFNNFKNYLERNVFFNSPGVVDELKNELKYFYDLSEKAEDLDIEKDDEHFYDFFDIIRVFAYQDFGFPEDYEWVKKRMKFFFKQFAFMIYLRNTIRPVHEMVGDRNLYQDFVNKLETVFRKYNKIKIVKNQYFDEKSQKYLDKNYYFAVKESIKSYVKFIQHLKEFRDVIKELEGALVFDLSTIDEGEFIKEELERVYRKVLGRFATAGPDETESYDFLYNDFKIVKLLKDLPKLEDALI